LDASYFNVTKVYLPQHMILNVVLSVIMTILALIIVGDALIKWTALIKDKKALENQKIRHKEILRDIAAK
jgi:carbon starvation protein